MLSGKSALYYKQPVSEKQAVGGFRGLQNFLYFSCPFPMPPGIFRPCAKPAATFRKAAARGKLSFRPDDRFFRKKTGRRQKLQECILLRTDRSEQGENKKRMPGNGTDPGIYRKRSRGFCTGEAGPGTSLRWKGRRGTRRRSSYGAPRKRTRNNRTDTGNETGTSAGEKGMSRKEKRTTRGAAALFRYPEGADAANY